MNLKKLDMPEAHLEDEMQKLFNATTLELTDARLNQLARTAAQIPKEPKQGLSPWMSHVSGLSCIALAFIVLSDLGTFQSSSGQSPDILVEASPVDLIAALRGSAEHGDWESEIQGVGFELFHISGSLDAAVLEGSFEALLNEKKQ
jgi:hypothetical protein